MAKKCPHCGSYNTEYRRSQLGGEVGGKVIKGAAVLGGLLCDFGIQAGKAALGIKVPNKNISEMAFEKSSSEYGTYNYYVCNSCGESFDD